MTPGPTQMVEVEVTQWKTPMDNAMGALIVSQTAAVQKSMNEVYFTAVMQALKSQLTTADTNALETKKDTRRRRADTYSFSITWSNTVSSTKLAMATKQASAFAAGNATFAVEFKGVQGLDCSSGCS